MPYIHINNYTGLGQMGISLAAINTIAKNAVSEIAGAKVSKKTTSGFPPLDFLSPDTIQTHLTPEGKALVSLDVELPRTCNVPEVCLAIQKKVSDAIRLACDTIPCEVKIRVTKMN